MRYVPDARRRVLAAARELHRRGLVEGTAGNISARQRDGTVVITPSAVAYAAMSLDDLVVIDVHGETLDSKPGRTPSSERMLHLACYGAFDDIASVVHSHPVFATMFAVVHQDIPACIDEFTMYVGGEVRCARYAPSGSADVGQMAVEALDGRGAALLANHGLVAVGPDPRTALQITALVERSANITWGARALGAVNALPAEVTERFAAHYSGLRNPPE